MSFASTSKVISNKANIFHEIDVKNQFKIDHHDHQFLRLRQVLFFRFHFVKKNNNNNNNK